MSEGSSLQFYPVAPGIALELRIPWRTMRVLELEVDLKGAQQRALLVLEREPRVFEVHLGLHLVALRRDQLFLELQQIVGRRHPDLEADLLVMERLRRIVGRL